LVSPRLDSVGGASAPFTFCPYFLDSKKLLAISNRWINLSFLPLVVLSSPAWSETDLLDGLSCQGEEKWTIIRWFDGSHVECSAESLLAKVSREMDVDYIQNSRDDKLFREYRALKISESLERLRLRGHVLSDRSSSVQQFTNAGTGNFGGVIEFSILRDDAAQKDNDLPTLEGYKNETGQ